MLPNDNIGFGVAHLGDGTFVVAASVMVLQDGQPTPVKRAWLRAYN